MARTDNLTNYLTDVAAAIKSKKGDNSPILASNFDTEIENLPSGGGETSGYFSNYSQTSQTSSVGNIIARIVKKVPDDIVINLQKINNWTFNFTGMFKDCTNLEETPYIDFSVTNQISNCYNGCSSLKKLYKINGSNFTFINNAFRGCKSLEEFDGIENIGQSYSTTVAANYANYTLDLSSCTKLSYESLIKIINGLYDIASKGCNPQSLKLGATNLAKLTEEEIAIATEKGWNVS